MNPDIEGVSHNGVRRIYRVLCNLAWCDGEVADLERALLEETRNRFRIEPYEAASLEAEGKEGNNLGVGRRDAERELMIDTMIDMVMVDGQLVAEEQERLIKFGVTFGLDQTALAKRIVARAGTRRLKAGD